MRLMLAAAAMLATALSAVAAVGDLPEEQRLIGNVAYLLKAAGGGSLSNTELQVLSRTRAVLRDPKQPRATPTLLQEVEPCVFEMRSSQERGFRVDFTRLSDRWERRCGGGTGGCQTYFYGSAGSACLLFASGPQCTPYLKVYDPSAQPVGSVQYVQSHGCAAAAPQPPKPKF